MINKTIKKFKFEGVVADTGAVAKSRPTWENVIVQQMTDAGYVRVLDLDPHFSLVYDKEKEQFQFTLIIHGIYLGKRQALLYAGVAGEKLIPKPTPQTKSEQ